MSVAICRQRAFGISPELYGRYEDPSDCSFSSRLYKHLGAIFEHIISLFRDIITSTNLIDHCTLPCLEYVLRVTSVHVSSSVRQWTRLGTYIQCFLCGQKAHDKHASHSPASTELDAFHSVSIPIPKAKCWEVGIKMKLHQLWKEVDREQSLGKGVSVNANGTEHKACTRADHPRQ